MWGYRSSRSDRKKWDKTERVYWKIYLGVSEKNGFIVARCIQTVPGDRCSLCSCLCDTATVSGCNKQLNLSLLVDEVLKMTVVYQSAWPPEQPHWRTDRQSKKVEIIIARDCWRLADYGRWRLATSKTQVRCSSPLGTAASHAADTGEQWHRASTALAEDVRSMCSQRVGLYAPIGLLLGDR